MGLGLWWKAFTKPGETFPQEKENATVGRGIKNFAILYGLMGLLFGILIAFFSANFLAVPGLELVAGIGPITIVVMPIVTAIGGVAVSIIIIGIINLSSKLLGGKGTMTELYYLNSLVVIPMFLLGLIPIIGQLVSLYGMYLGLKAISVAHDIGIGKALIAIIIGLVIAMILYFLIIFGSLFLIGGLAETA